MKGFFYMLETIVGKGENAGYEHFSPFPRMFMKDLFLWGFKSCVVRLCGKELSRGPEQDRPLLIDDNHCNKTQSSPSAKYCLDHNYALAASGLEKVL